jgi:hypothetical protein
MHNFSKHAVSRNSLGILDFEIIHPMTTAIGGERMAQMKQIESEIIPLVRERDRLERLRRMTESYYRTAVASKNRSEMSKFDRALSDAAVALSSVLGSLEKLNRDYRALQRSLVY